MKGKDFKILRWTFMKGMKRLIPAALSAALLVSGAFGAYPAAASTQDEIDSAEAKKSAAESEYSSVQDRISALQTKKDNAQEYLQDLNDQLTDLNQQLDELQQKYSATQEEYDTVNQELADAQAEENVQAKNMALRIKYIYENGTGTGALETLFSSGNFSDFLNESTNVSELTSYDRKVLKEYNQICETITEKQQEVQKESEAISALQEESKSKREEIQDLVDSTRQDVQEYADSLEGEQNAAADLLASIEEQQANIDTLNEKAADEVAAADAAAAETARTSTETAISNEGSQKPASDAEASGSSSSAAESARSATTANTSETAAQTPAATPTAAPTPTPAPTQAAPAENASSSGSYSGGVLTAAAGRIEGPSGQETYYNMDMSGVVSIMRSMGNTDEYWVRSDGVKMLGSYVMVAANLSVRPRGSLIATSLGMGIVVDTGGFAAANPTQLDIATNW